ncbi:protein lifeguard 1-like [Panonychus citri]|uniref:protein lifeguard 1-like n=1 Tax=Panonychus citri TaxID=50023 RepID=UPI00230812B6|nr:protein lifeguard 1-like [Panonychus citri]
MDSENQMEAGIQPEAQFNVFSDKLIRLKFIRKVYGIVCIQLMVTLGFVLAFNLSPELGYLAAEPGLGIVAVIVSLASLITLACCGAARSFPCNIICLGIFTLSESISVAFITVSSSSEVLIYAIIVTTIVVVSLTLFAFQTKIDFTVCNGILFIFLIILLVFGILAVFIRNKIFHLLYACGGALIFSLYLIIDTQMIVGGNRKHQFSPEDYVLAAITLYLDIINLFIFILRILNSNN